MLKPLVQAQPHASTLLLLQRPNFSVDQNLFSFRHVPGDRTIRRRQRQNGVRILAISSDPSSSFAVASNQKTVTVKAVVTVQLTVTGLFTNVGIDRGLDDIADVLGKSILLELVSAELDPKTGLEKESIKGYVRKGVEKDGKVTYEGNFQVKPGFGNIGAVFVTNEHHKEMYFQNIVLTGFSDSPIHLTCNSWVHAKSDNPEKRVFFTDKLYLPSQTPEGLKRLRSKELEILRGNGQGERKVFERIYDYDTYNDLGDPDKSDDLARPVLGGKEHPYPRRCRTGRPRTKKDPLSESKTKNLESPYVPRDEAFSEVKGLTFSAKTLKSVLHSLVPSLESLFEDPKLGFPFFTSIDSLYNEGVALKKPPSGGSVHSLLLPRLVKLLEEGSDEILLYETPEMLERDKFAWVRDEEFARQTLAGLNPLSIQLVTEFPLKSKLDPKIYGPPESAITKGIIEREMRSVMTLEQALERKKLFMLDYHDLYLPYVHKVRELEGTTLYGSRTIFYLTEGGTLQPIAIELTRPASPTKPQWKKVFSPSSDATGCWLWRLAKAHVAAHDAGYHQLVIHWLRTHCCTEPYIIAANRQLSAVHPIYRLLYPHFRYTMEINALARKSFINAGGIIEANFSPGKYSMELSSVAYDKLWRFDHQALPADLISRGMAIVDQSNETGVKLVIEDYPFANDGLLIWSTLKKWVSDYVTRFYSDPSAVSLDEELQSWWKEVKTEGHGDKKDELWWPQLETPNDLIHILTIIIWVVSGHHEAVNFRHYPYGGYFPNRPTIVRKKMPTEDECAEECSKFLRKPENALLNSFPTQIQATKVLAILDVLSTHSPDEEYLRENLEPAWSSKKTAKRAKKERDDAIAAAQESDPRRRSIRIWTSEENISQSSLAPPQPQSSPTPSQPKDKGKGEKGRGQTTSKYENKAKREIIFDEYGKPVGPGVKISQLGVWVRQHIPITYHTWHHVPKIMKKNVWNLLKQNYPNEQMDKKEMRNTMAKIWRDVQSDCSINVRKLLDKLEKTKSVAEVDAIQVQIGNLRPWFCSRATWDDFVKFRTPEEWKAFIEKYQGIRASFDLVHRSSRPRLRRRLTFPLMHTSMQRKVKLMHYKSTSIVVAVGELMSVDPNEHVHSVPIGEGNGKVLIKAVIIPCIRLFRETPDAKSSDEAVGSMVAWPLYAIRDI